ncbi:MAG: cupin [Planctomycetaceae bacterium]
MSDDQDIATDVGTRLLFENERVRVWDLRLPPGSSTGLHEHRTDYLYVVIGDGRLQTTFSDGSSADPRDMHDGDVRFRSVADTAVHSASNVGDAEWRNIVVELKSPESHVATDPAD